MKTHNSDIIQAQTLGKTFSVKSQEVTVLKNINFAIRAGEFLVIFGPSGCGKSTLLHTILGLEPPTSGQVVFQGQSLYNNLTEDERAELRKHQIGMVYQQPNWIKSLTAKENVMFALRLTGLTEAAAATKAHAALEQVGMVDWSDYIPTELSSGQQQRVALARAIVTDPTILIADEPTGNLDYESGRQLMGLLGELNRQGKTVIMVTHDLEYLNFAQRALEMLDGEIIQELIKPSAPKKSKSGNLKRASGKPSKPSMTQSITVEDL